MKIAVIGGTGLMGPSVVKQLREEAETVYCINRSGKDPESLNNAYSCDRNDKTNLNSVINIIKPDLIIDMIPFTEEQAITLSSITKNSGIPVIAISSIDIYKAYNILHRTINSSYQEYPITEDAELRKELSFQGKAYDKLNVEKVYLNDMKDITILRLPAIYGWPDTSRIKHYVDHMLIKAEPIKLNPGFSKWRFTRSLNLNCAFAITCAREIMGQSIYNVGELESHTEEKWFSLIAEHLNWKYGIEKDSNIETPYNIDTNQQWVVCSNKIRNELGYYEKFDVVKGLH